MPIDRTSIQAPLAAARLVFGVVGFSFAGIGIATIIAMWATPFHSFGSPPLFFRIVASFIALTFVGMGGTLFVGAIVGGRLLGQAGGLDQTSDLGLEDRPGKPASAVGYSCPKCGAQIAGKADVSPLGDVKCQYCQQWFNIHNPPTAG